MALLADWLGSTTAWETLAVVCALAYVWLATRENILCWWFALVSTAIYTVLFWNVSLLMESALNVYYLAMAVYGWWQWQSVTPHHEARRIHPWPWRWHAVALAGVIAVSACSGWLLTRYTGAALPYLDSFTTWAAVFATWLVARKVLENWLWWIVIDAISIYLYLDRGLLQTAALFALYVLFAGYGYLHWRALLASRATVPATSA